MARYSQKGNSHAQSKWNTSKIATNFHEWWSIMKSLNVDFFLQSYIFARVAKKSIVMRWNFSAWVPKLLCSIERVIFGKYKLLARSSNILNISIIDNQNYDDLSLLWIENILKPILNLFYCTNHYIIGFIINKYSSVISLLCISPIISLLCIPSTISITWLCGLWFTGWFFLKMKSEVHSWR